MEVVLMLASSTSKMMLFGASGSWLAQVACVPEAAPF